MNYEDEDEQSVEQDGFWLQSSTVEKVFVLRQLAARSLQVKYDDMFTVIINFKKAFESVMKTCMFRVMEHYKIPEKLINFIKNLYNRA